MRGGGDLLLSWNSAVKLSSVSYGHEDCHHMGTPGISHQRLGEILRKYQTGMRDSVSLSDYSRALLRLLSLYVINFFHPCESRALIRGLRRRRMMPWYLGFLHVVSRKNNSKDHSRGSKLILLYLSSTFVSFHTWL